MKLYTAKVIALWLCLTERRVRQLRDTGILQEAAPGLYELQPTIARYIEYLRSGGLTDERTKLTAAKRESVEMDNDQRRGELHHTEDVERAVKSMILNTRSRMLLLPDKLSPAVAALGGDREKIHDLLKHAIWEALEECSDAKNALRIEAGGDGADAPGEDVMA